MNKKEIAVIISKLKQIDKPSIKLEQYATDSEIAAYIAWIAYLNYDIDGKIIADLGCGNGILGLASLMLGAKKCYFIDVSKESIDIAKENLEKLQKELNTTFNADFLLLDINEVKIKVDTVLQNPPFGTKIKHADKSFLEKAMQIADSIYSIHKIESQQFIYKLASSHDFRIERIIEFELPIRRMHSFHKKKVYKVDTACWHLKRNI